MKIAVDALPAAGRDLPFTKADPWALEAVTTSLDRSPDRLEGLVKLRRGSVPNVVLVDVAAKAAIDATPCDRCGETCALEVAIDVRMLFAPEASDGAAFDGMSIGTSDGEVELRAEDLDLGWYTKGSILLGDVLCEAMALAAPSRVVCADVAGCDKRTGDLLSATQVNDSPFAKLAALRREPGEG